jgi:hypothetical protein
MINVKFHLVILIVFKIQNHPSDRALCFHLKLEVIDPLEKILCSLNFIHFFGSKLSLVDHSYFRFNWG